MSGNLVPIPNFGKGDEQVDFTFSEPGYYEPGGRWDVKYLPHLPLGQKYWRSQGGQWRPVATLVLRREFPGNNKEFDQFLFNIKNRNYLPPSFATPPFFLPESGPIYDETANPQSPPKIVRCLSGDIDLENEKLKPFDSRYIATAVIPVRLDSHARAPVFSSFIRSLVDCDGQRQFLLEYLGLCMLLCFNQFKKLLCLVGPRDCGKSVLMFVFEQLIGASNCCHLSNKALASQFGLSNSVGKLVNVSNEEAWPTRLECYIIKAVSGGDTLPMEIKHGPILSVRPTIRLINVSNDKVHFPDPHIWGRVAIVQCRDSIPRDQQDFHLREKLVAELPGIFLVLLASVINLFRRGDFDDVRSMQESRDEAMRYSNHLIDFCEDCFELLPDELLTEADIVEAYTHYCRDGNFRATADIGVIKEKLREVYSLDGTRHRQRIDGQRLPALKGIQLTRYFGKRGRILQRSVLAEEVVGAAAEERRKAERAAKQAKESLRQLRAINRAERMEEADINDRERIDEVIHAARENEKARIKAEKTAQKVADLAREAAVTLTRTNERVLNAINPPRKSGDEPTELLTGCDFDCDDPELNEIMKQLDGVAVDDDPELDELFKKMGGDE